MIPLEEAIQEIPAIDLSFFDPAAGKYMTITRGPFPIKVEKPDKEEKIAIISNQQQNKLVLGDEQLGRDIVYIKISPGRFFTKGSFLFHNYFFLWMHLLPPLFFLAISLFYKRRRKLQNNPHYARWLYAPKKAQGFLRKARQYCSSNDSKMFYDTVFQTLQEYLGDKFHLPSQGITISVIDEVLKSRGIDESVLLMIRGLFRECDPARYAPLALGKDAMLHTLKQLEEVIIYFQKNKF
jgi:hypothetical protein